MILSIVFLVLFCFIFIQSWIFLLIMLTTMTLSCLLIMNQNFSYSLNMMSSNNTMSNLMLFLTVYLILLVVLATKSYSSMKYNCMLIMLLGFLIFTFTTSNIFYFYIFFEASLIPTLALIVGWGYQPERLQAGVYMMIYTVLASLPLLAMISILYSLTNTSDFYLLKDIYNTWSSISVVFIYLAFLVKLPIYSGHLWLPKAHVEAPLAGSMILAGVLLKLGGYGLVMMNMSFCLGGNHHLVTSVIISISMWGSLLASMMCMRQVDVKSFVAYSSVSHMSLVILGTIYQQSWSLSSAVVTMFAHAFSSSALFCLAYYTYEKISSRSLLYIKGFLSLFPMLSIMWFLFTCINMAAPPTLNLLGEMMIIPVLSEISMGMLGVMGVCIFLSAVYNMMLYLNVNHGKPSEYVLGANQLSSNQLLVLVMHLVPLLFILKTN
uniref:NADH-ubiquinone oxidoreductase chain 4 n=1 Tax=Physa fontinalis TaxID=146087 RepID=A0A7D6W4U0_9GAST|nr:NADH dehydrogenase subunit 4 [Physa fontinalis]